MLTLDIPVLNYNHIRPLIKTLNGNYQNIWIVDIGVCSLFLIYRPPIIILNNLRINALKIQRTAIEVVTSERKLMHWIRLDEETHVRAKES